MLLWVHAVANPVAPSALVVWQAAGAKKGGAQPRGFSDHNARWLKPKQGQQEASSEEEELGSEEEEEALSGEEFSEGERAADAWHGC